MNETSGVRLEGLINITVFPDTIAPPCVEPRVEGDLCLGQPASLSLSGDTITGALEKSMPLTCHFAGLTTAAVATNSERTSASCPMPPLLGPLPNFTLAVGNRTAVVPIGKFDVPTCSSSDGPTGKVCAGDVYNVSASGLSVGGLLELVPAQSVLCEIGNATTPAFINLDASTVTCAVPRWAPWSADQRAIIDIGEFSVRFGTAAAITGTLPKASLCLETSSHAGGGERRLQSRVEEFPECFPACCKRESVTISFAGNTIGVLSERPEQVNCAFLRVDGETVNSNVSFPTPTTVQCSEVEGWRPDSGARGDYSAVTIQVLGEVDQSVEFELGGHSYNPSSASNSCVSAQVDDSICRGIDLFRTTLEGPTVEALEAFREESNGQSEALLSCALNGETALVEDMGCAATVLAASEGSVDLRSLTVQLAGIEALEFNVSSVTVTSCMPGLDASTTCPNNRFNSKVSFVSEYDQDALGISGFICRLIGSQAETLEVLASGNQTQYSCEIDTTGSVFEFVEIVDTDGKNLTLDEVPMDYDPVTCAADRSNPPATAPPSEDGLDPGWIALIVVLLVLLLLLCLVYCYRYRKKKKKKHRDAEELEEGIPSPEPQDLKREVSEGDAPEEPKDITLEVPYEEERTEEAKAVVLDSPIAKTPPAGKFQPDDLVEVRVFDQNDPAYNSFAILNVGTQSPQKGEVDRPDQVWKKGRVVRRNSDNMTYAVKLDDDTVENFVAEQAIRVRQPGVQTPRKTTSFQGSVRPDVLKEDGSFKYPVKKPLDYRELPENQFEMTINRAEGLGIKLGITEAGGSASGGRIVISEFTDIPEGGWGPLEGSGLVGISDELLEINGVSVIDMPLRGVDKLIRESPEQMKLKFGRNHEGPVNLFTGLTQT